MMWKQWIQFGFLLGIGLQSPALGSAREEGFLLGIGLQSPALGMERLEEASASAAPMPASEKPCAPGARDTVLGNSDLSCHILSFLTPEIVSFLNIDIGPDQHFYLPRNCFSPHQFQGILNMAKCNRAWHALVWKLSFWENIVFSAKPAIRTPISFGPNKRTLALREESLRAVKQLRLHAEDKQHLEILQFFPGLQAFIPKIQENHHVLEAALLRLPKELKHLYLRDHATLSQCDLKVLSRFQDLKSLDVSFTDLRGEFLAYLSSTLEELNLLRTQMTPEDGKQLAKFPTLSKLKLSNASTESDQSFLAHAPATLTHLNISRYHLATMNPQILKRFSRLRTFSPLSCAGLGGDREFQTPSRINAVLLGLHPEALQHLSADMDFRFATLGEENLPVFKQIQGWKNLVLPDSLGTPGLLEEIIRIAAPTLQHLAFKKTHEDHSASFNPSVLRLCAQLKTCRMDKLPLDINAVKYLPPTMTHLHLSGEELLTEGSAPSYGRFKNLTSLALDRVTQRQSVIEILQNVCPDHVRTIYLSPTPMIEDPDIEDPDNLLPLLMRFKNLQNFFCYYYRFFELSPRFKQKLNASMPTVKFCINYEYS